MDFPLTAEQNRQFNEHRLAVKYDGEPNRWLTFVLADRRTVQIRPAKCSAPNCFCDAVWREPPKPGRGAP